MFKFFPQLTFIFLMSAGVSPLYSDQIYKWTDDSGVRNYSNIPNKVPGQLFSAEPDYKTEPGYSKAYISRLELERQRKDYFLRLKRMQAQRDLINEIRDILERELNLHKQYEQKQKLAIESKRDFDKKIIEGYFADNSIIELKKFEVEMENINHELQLLIPRKKKLISIAKKQGINEDI